jgi:DNA polymerase-3 subunit delta
MISRQIRILLMTRQALDSGVNPRRLAPELKLHPYVAQKSAAQAAKFKLIDLKNIFSRLVEIDYKLKTGQAEANSTINLLMAKI